MFLIFLVLIIGAALELFVVFQDKKKNGSKKLTGKQTMLVIASVLVAVVGVFGAVNAANQTEPKEEQTSKKSAKGSSEDDNLDEEDYEDVDDVDDDYDSEEAESEDTEHPDIKKAFNITKLSEGRYSNKKLMTTGFSMNANVLSTGKNKAGANVILMNTDDVPDTYFLLIDKSDVTGDLSKGDLALFEGVIIGDTVISDSTIDMGISDEYYSEPAYLLQADSVY